MLFRSLLAAGLFLSSLQTSLRAQPATDTTTNSADPTALELERTNACSCKFCANSSNQPVHAYERTENLPVSVYSPGWFHDGASVPPFDTVDVRKSQELNYANKPYVTSDLTPGVVFMGRDLEFNSMTKLFYTNRNVPKHKLSEAEMLEINRLYRIIGHCNTELFRQQASTEAAADQTAGTDTNTETVAPPPGLIGKIQAMPREKRALYGGIGIGVLLVIVIGLRLIKGKSSQD